MFHVLGIMVLEKQLLSIANSEGSQPSPAKKARGGSKPLPEGTEMWVELSKWVQARDDYVLGVH